MEKSDLQQAGNQAFSGYIADPSKTGSADAEQVKNLLDKFPYCQILHSVYSHCLIKQEDQFITQLEKTSFYSPDRELLFKIIHQPQELFNSKDQTVDAVADEVNGSNNQILPSGANEDTKNHELDENTVDPDIDTDQIGEQSGSIIPEDTLTNLQPENADSDNTEPAVVPDTLGNEIVSEPVNSKADNDFIDDEEAVNTQPNTETESIVNVNPENSTPTEPDLDEVNESQAQPGSTGHGKIETVTPDNDNLVAEPQKEPKGHDLELDEQLETDTIETVVPENDNFAAGPQVEDKEIYANPVAFTKEEDEKYTDTEEEDETGQLILADIVATDFFAFEESLENNQAHEELTENDTETESPQSVQGKLHTDEPSNIVRYDDDKLPYTFLWWLDKTRKQHAGNYQPYLNLKPVAAHELKKNSVTDLNHQIIQNIFSLQPPFHEAEVSEQNAPHTPSREEVIIQKFIEEEPQIKPPHPEKADNENKARKSSEDANDLVSETLAVIYTDQMLFHKAIDTYKKLSLKFPEKSPYFADQIKELDKKINREP